MTSETAMVLDAHVAQQAATGLLQALHPVNLLSFGPDSPEIALGPLNILIGPNGSGKSNLIETISLLRSSAIDMQETIRRGGGVAEWIWKGSHTSKAFLSAIIANPQRELPLHHSFSIAMENQAFEFSNEQIRDAGAPECGQAASVFFPKSCEWHATCR